MFDFIFKKRRAKEAKSEIITRNELEKRAVESAKRAVKDYKRVFERLAEYDRT